MKYGAHMSGVGSLMSKLDNIASPKGSTKGIKVGIVESATYPIEKGKGRIQGKTAPQVAEVAFWNEFGTQNGKIPSRPFMRNSIKDMMDSRAVSNAIRSSVDATNPVWDNAAAMKLAPILIAIMQKAMKDPNFPPNSPVTKMFKAGSPTANTTPLIDTGLLRRSIDAQLLGPGDK